MPDWLEILIAIPLLWYGFRWLDRSKLNCWLGNHHYKVVWGESVVSTCEICGKTLSVSDGGEDRP